MKRCFIDSNIIVYANDVSAGVKQERAIDITIRLMQAQTGVVSTQVMQEYAKVALDKLHQEPEIVLRQLKLMETFIQSPITSKTTRRAVEIKTAYQISFWDANIISSAESADCDIILSEDLNDGQLYAGIQIVNPFGQSIEISKLFP